MRRQANLFPSWSYITLAGWLYPWAKSKFTQRERAAGQEGSHVSTFQMAADMYPADWHVWKKCWIVWNVALWMFFLMVFPEARKRSQRINQAHSSQRSGHPMKLSDKWEEMIIFPISLAYHTPKQIGYDFLCGLAGSEDKCDSERPVDSSIICCLSCLIKHIIDHPRTNDSHPITHESSGFGITTTWPWRELTGCAYRVRVYPLLRHSSPAFAVARLRMWLSALPKTVGGEKNAITARLSYCFRLTFLTEFMNIYESILHLNLNPRFPL